MNLNDTAKEKLSFLQQTKHTKDHESFLSIVILGVKFNLYFKNIPTPYLESLKSYYAPFKENHQRIDKEINIYYRAFEDDRKSLNHHWYSSKLPYIHFIPTGNHYHVIERDYCALFEQGLQDIFCYGPCPGLENPDSLDNLLSSLFSSCNQFHQSMILHSASIVRDGKAYVFFGESGAGKSTLAFHCFKNFNQLVISSDQTYLRLEEGKVIAQSTPITIPEIPRDTPMRLWSPVEVISIIHLTQKGAFGFRSLPKSELLKKFIAQSDMYLSPFSHQQSYLDLCSQILTNSSLQYGELTYEKDSDPWKLIDLSLK